MKLRIDFQTIKPYQRDLIARLQWSLTLGLEKYIIALNVENRKRPEAMVALIGMLQLRFHKIPRILLQKLADGERQPIWRIWRDMLNKWKTATIHLVNRTLDLMDKNIFTSPVLTGLVFLDDDFYPPSFKKPRQTSQRLPKNLPHDEQLR